MKIQIASVDTMRYDTIGDWEGDPRDLLVTVVEMANVDHVFLVAIHELVEAYLCWKDGVSQSEVDQFDFMQIGAGGDGEPGDDPLAPYHRQHVRATLIERQMADFLGVDWNEYEKAIESQEVSEGT